MKASTSMTPLRPGFPIATNISTTTSPLWKIWERRISTWSATTSCPCSTGPEPELARLRPDGSTVLAYTQEAVDNLNPEEMFSSISSDTNGSIMPGWEPERMEHIKELFEMYRNVDDEALFANLKYFLERIMPVCDKYDINMAIHPDDPAWSVFGLPRIIINKANILRMMKMVDNPHNGVTFCSGSYGTNLENDLPDMIRSLKGRIHFAHVRNLKFNSPPISKRPPIFPPTAPSICMKSCSPFMTSALPAPSVPTTAA